MNRDLYSLTYPWLRIEGTRPVHCCLCGGANPTEIVTTFRVNGTSFSIRRCNGDSLMWMDPNPGSQFKQDLYSHPSYFSGVDDMYGLVTDDERSTSIALMRVAEIRKHSPKAASLLEFGSGKGHLLRAALASGFTSVQGVEISQAAADYCRSAGVPVIQSNLDADIPDLRGRVFDIVAGFSVLEHLDEPLQFLRAIRRYVSPQGALVIRVPDTDPETGPTLSLVDHLWHFTRVSLEHVLVSAGFRVVGMYESGVFTGIQHPGVMKNVTVVAQLH